VPRWPDPPRHEVVTMRNIEIGRLRIFWRGWDCPQRPYWFRRWAITAFGVGPIGVMVFRHHAP
jgi:hypothetical protein